MEKTKKTKPFGWSFLFWCEGWDFRLCDLLRQTVHWTVWCFAQIAPAIFSPFKSHPQNKKTKPFGWSFFVLV